MLPVHAAVERNINAAAANEMIVILKRIPEDTKKRDIANFLKPALKGKLFRKSGAIDSLKILVLHDPKTNELEYHGLVSFDTDEAAIRVIKLLNRKFFIDKGIALNEFHRRCWENDPRVSCQSWDGQRETRRKGDRRRQNLKEKKRISFGYIN